MNTPVTVDRSRAAEMLNELLQLEYTGLAQYTQHGLLIRGPERLVWAPWFYEQAQECLTHARLVGEKIVALGAVPTVERLAVQQATVLEEMLRLDLDLERRAVAGYQAALDELGGDTPLRVLLENQVLEETTHVEELERILAEGPTAIRAGATPARAVRGRRVS
jgi:bacterioferritin